MITKTLDGALKSNVRRYKVKVGLNSSRIIEKGPHKMIVESLTPCQE